MTVTELTGVLAAIGGVIVALGTYLGTVRAARRAAADSTINTWQELSAEYKADRDKARAELADVDSKYRARIRDLEQDYQTQLTAMRTRITQLENDLAGVTRSQFGPHPKLPP